MTQSQFSFSDLSCPLDLTTLKAENNTFKCQKGHCFDKAKQGYINLLPVQFKNSLNPGDNKEMVLARSAFLNEGYYEPIAQQLLQIIQNSLTKETTLIDAGCGEGYYTNFIFNQLIKQHPQSSFSFLGFDISKEAIKQASKRSKNICWAVATNQKIPTKENCADILISLFGFPVLSEFTRVLKNNGLLIIATAGQNHLIEIRKQIYQEIHTKKETNIIHPHLQLTEKISLKKEIFVSSDEAVMHLLKMTPHFYRIPIEKRTEIMKNLPHQLTLNVVFYCFNVIKD